MYIKRHLESAIRRLKERVPVIWVSGPRQAGKTTMLQHLAEEENRRRAYLNLEDPAVQAEAREDPDAFLRRHAPPLFLDEVQNAPELLPFLNHWADVSRHPGDFWLSSSVNTPDLAVHQKAMGGLAAMLHLYPLSQREIAGMPCVPFFPTAPSMQAAWDSAKPAAYPTLFAHITKGFMPVPNAQQHIYRDRFYTAWLNTYIEKDIRHLAPNINEAAFRRFLPAAAKSCTKPLAYSALAKKAGIDVATARDWIHLLAATEMIFLLSPDSLCALQNTARAPKLYWMDTGLLCHLAGKATSRRDNQAVWQDQLLEDFAIAEIVKGYAGAGRDLSGFLSFYRPPEGREISLVMRDKDARGHSTLHPVLIQRTPCASPEKFFQVLDHADVPRSSGAVLSADPVCKPLPPDNWAAPIWIL